MTPAELPGPLTVAPGDIAEAIESGEIVPWYQPQVDLRSGEVVGLEALARWLLPGGEVRLPDSFVPVAEETQLVVDLDDAVMRQAFADVRRWRLRWPDLRVSINLSGRNLDRRGWLSVLSRAVQESGVPPSAIDLEISETARPADPDATIRALLEARERGFRVWFDDFGSGWSGLYDLIRLPVDGVKFDRSFALLLGTRVHDTVVGSLVSGLRELGLRVIMEGIERPEQAFRAAELGCGYGQGYLWSRPVAPDRVPGLLQGWAAAPVG